jgi:hypothetical protein
LASKGDYNLDSETQMTIKFIKKDIDKIPCSTIFKEPIILNESYFIKIIFISGDNLILKTDIILNDFSQNGKLSFKKVY